MGGDKISLTVKFALYSVKESVMYDPNPIWNFVIGHAYVLLAICLAVGELLSLMIFSWDREEFLENNSFGLGALAIAVVLLYLQGKLDNEQKS